MNMNNNCQLVVFSDKAYNAIIRETFEWDPVETGGILLGHILDNGCWIVMEVLPPGYGEQLEGNRVFHEFSYFEYNQKFVNYLAKSVSEQYEIPLELLGLWHRHPGSMDHFSGTDDRTNSLFAAQNPHGVISGLVNIDPQLRMTMYYLSSQNVLAGHSFHLNYQKVDIEVGSDLIPDKYFKLRYYHGEEDELHPYAPIRQQQESVSDVNGNGRLQSESNDNRGEKNYGVNCRREKEHNNCPSSRYQKSSSVFYWFQRYKQFIVLFFAFFAFIFISLFAIKKNLNFYFGNGKRSPIELNASEQNSDPKTSDMKNENIQKTERDSITKDGDIKESNVDTHSEDSIQIA